MCINDIAISLHIEDANYVFDPNWISKNELSGTTGPTQTNCRSQYAPSKNKQEMGTRDNFDFSSNIYYTSIILGVILSEGDAHRTNTYRKERNIDTKT